MKSNIVKYCLVSLAIVAAFTALTRVSFAHPHHPPHHHPPHHPHPIPVDPDDDAAAAFSITATLFSLFVTTLADADHARLEDRPSTALALMNAEATEYLEALEVDPEAAVPSGTFAAKVDEAQKVNPEITPAQVARFIQDRASEFGI